MFKNVAIRDNENICHEWGNHFASLYSDTACQSYNSKHYEFITECVSSLKEESSIEDGDQIVRYEVIIALSSLKAGMCGMVKMCNKHLIHGGLMLNYFI